MPEVRFHNAQDERREAAVGLLKVHVRGQRPESHYEADLEYLDEAIVAFADEWAQGELSPVVQPYDELRSAVERLLAGARSFCESWVYTPPEGLGLHWKTKIQPALADLDALLHPADDDATRKER